MTHKLFHCWDCGTKVIEQTEGKYKPLPTLQQMRFRLSNGAYMVNPFCESCGNREWTPEGLAEFKAAILPVMPTFAEVTITACEGPVSLISGVAR